MPKNRRCAVGRRAPHFCKDPVCPIFSTEFCAICTIVIILKVWYYNYRKRGNDYEICR